MSCRIVDSICLTIGEKKPFGFDLANTLDGSAAYLVNYWAPGEVYASGNRVRPRALQEGGKGPNGYEYECTTAGQTANREPTWPTTLGGAVTSGSAVFTCRALSNSSLAKTIISSSWSVPTGITSSGATTETSNGEQKTAVFLEATAVVDKQLVVNTITFSDGHIEELALEVTVEAVQS